MGGTDDLIYNTLERALSTDLNDTESIKDRVLLDSWRRTFGRIINPVALGSVPSSSPRAVCLGGLEVVPNGNDVDVQPGVLLQDSATLAPVPSSIDSDYRVGINRAAELAAMPSPAGTSWVLIEANMVRVVTLTTPRDIFDPGTGVFVPTPVDKRSERQLDFTVSAASLGTIPAPSGGNLIPIAAVRRPGGGGPVLSTDIYDLRPMWQNRAARSGEEVGGGGSSNRQYVRRGQVYMRAGTVDGTASNLIQLDAEAYSERGERLWFTGVDVDVSTVTFMADGEAVTGGAWHYLYLAPFRDGTVHNAYGAAAQANCVLVVSQAAPASRAGLNGAAVTPAAPFNTSALLNAGVRPAGGWDATASLSSSRESAGGGGLFWAGARRFLCWGIESALKSSLTESRYEYRGPVSEDHMTTKPAMENRARPIPARVLCIPIIYRVGAPGTGGGWPMRGWRTP